MIENPAQFEDINLRRNPADRTSWLPVTWEMPFTRNGIPMVWSESTFQITVLDNDYELMTLTVDVSGAADGVLAATITADQIKQLTGRYTTWQLFESPQYNDVILQGRFVRQA